MSGRIGHGRLYITMCGILVYISVNCLCIVSYCRPMIEDLIVVRIEISAVLSLFVLRFLRCCITFFVGQFVILLIQDMSQQQAFAER